MDLLSSFGPAGAVVAVVWLFFKYLVPAIDRLSKNIAANTKYLQDRNGRDSEVHKELMAQMHQNTETLYSVEKQRTREHKALLRAIPSGVTEMHVDKQVIDKAIIRK